MEQIRFASTDHGACSTELEDRLLSTSTAYGRDKAKVRLDSQLRAAEAERPAGKLILVSARPPRRRPAEGKTDHVDLGLAQGLCRIGKPSLRLALRPTVDGACVQAVKARHSAAGASRVEPSNTINLQFTGDFHAITAAHNLLAAAIDNRLHFGDIDLEIPLKRPLEMPRLST